jgi:hypothetical protein
MWKSACVDANVKEHEKLAIATVLCEILDRLCHLILKISINTPLIYGSIITPIILTFMVRINPIHSQD